MIFILSLVIGKQFSRSLLAETWGAFEKLASMGRVIKVRI
jgi:hypothetical protein